MAVWRLFWVPEDAVRTGVRKNGLPGSPSAFAHSSAASQVTPKRNGPTGSWASLSIRRGVAFPVRHTISQRLGDLLAGLEPGSEADAVRLLGAALPGHDRAGGVRAGHRRFRCRAADRGDAARRRARPAADRPHPAARHADHAGRSPARPPDPRPPGTD